MADASRASREDNRRAVDAWLASGRTIEEFYSEWLSSLTELFSDNYSLEEWRQEKAPLSRVWRKKAEHEALTGHRVVLAGFLSPR